MALPTPTPTDTLIYQNGVIIELLKPIAAWVAAHPAGESDPGPDPTDEIAAFKAKYTPLDNVAFEREFGVPAKTKLPALTAPYDPAQVKKWAQNGYNENGDYVGGPKVAASEGRTPEYVAALAIDDIAHGRASYWTINQRTGARLDPDVAAVVAMTGRVDSPGYREAFMEISDSRTPGLFAGQAFDDFVRAMAGGHPGIQL